MRCSVTAAQQRVSCSGGRSLSAWPRFAELSPLPAAQSRACLGSGPCFPGTCPDSRFPALCLESRTSPRGRTNAGQAQCPKGSRQVGAGHRQPRFTPQWGWRGQLGTKAGNVQELVLQKGGTGQANRRKRRDCSRSRNAEFRDSSSGLPVSALQQYLAV